MVDIEEKQTVSVPNEFSGKMLYDKLQIWKDTKGWSAKKMIAELGWHEQQFYALNRDKRMVRAKLLTHVITTLGIDPEFLFTERQEDSYVTIMKKYPTNVLRWLASDEGKRIMMEQYGVSMLEKAKQELRKEALDVYNA